MSQGFLRSFKNTYFAERPQAATSETLDNKNFLLPGFKVFADSLKNTCKGFHSYRLQQNHNRSLILCTDNSHITFFTINQFCPQETCNQYDRQLTCFCFSPCFS